MKKLCTLLVAMMMFTLYGCKDATADISNGSEALITVEGDSITNEDIYQMIKKSGGASETLNLAKIKLYEKEGIEVDDDMEKQAEEQIDSLKSMYGDDLEKTLQQFGFEDIDNYKETAIYPTLKQKALNKNYVKEKEDTLFGMYFPCKAQILEAESKEKAENALKALQNGEDFKSVVSKYGSGTTYNGEEEIYNSASGLPTTVFDKIKSTNKEELIDSVIEDTTASKFYVVNITNVTAKDFEEDAIDSIVTSASSDIETAAIAYYLKKYDFTIYDKDVYDGIKSINESYIVQE